MRWLSSVMMMFSMSFMVGLQALCGVSLVVVPAGGGQGVDPLQAAPERPPAVVEVALTMGNKRPGGRPPLIGVPYISRMYVGPQSIPG